MPFLRQLHNQKPQAYGPPSQVQSSIFKNAERIGINPASIALAMPMWGPGDQLDYARTRQFINNGATYNNNLLTFNSASQYLYEPSVSTYYDLNSNVSWSVIALLKRISGGMTQNIIRKDTGNGGRDLYGLRFISTDYLQVLFGDAGGTLHVSESASTLSDTLSFHSIATVINVSTDQVHLFIDQQKSVTTNTSTAWDTSLNPVGLYIGQYGSSENLCAYVANLTIIKNFIVSDSIIAYLSDNPYSLLQRIAPVFYSAPTVAPTTSKAGVIYLRRKHTQKPAMYGPPSQVQASIFKNAERIGIDPVTIKMLSGFGGIPNILSPSAGNNYGVKYVNNTFSFDASSQYITAPLEWPRADFTVLFCIKPTSFAGYNQTIYCSTGWDYFGFHTTTTGSLYVGTDMSFRFTPTELPDNTLTLNQNNIVAFKSNIIGIVNTGYFYKSGKLLASKGMYQSSDITYVSLGVNNSNTVRGELPIFYFFGVALPDSKIAFLSDNPYYLLQRIAPVFYSLPGGAIIPTPRNLAGVAYSDHIVWTWEAGV